jgi:DNA polymerase-3 subunit delta'
MLDYNQMIVKQLRTLLARGRLAHAYLFAGPASLGKSETALAAAQLVNCEALDFPGGTPPCGQCLSCRKTLSGNHPDVFRIDKGDNPSIRIAGIRELISRISLRPFEGRKKVFIIKDIEDLTLEGSNALLKTLEEPAKDTLLILTTSVPEDVLETLKSRCHIIRFFPMSRKELKTHLKEDRRLTEETIRFLAGFAEGCLGRARKLEEEKIFERKNQLIDQVVYTVEWEHLLKLVAGDKARAKELLDVLYYWFRDVLLIQCGVGEEALIHGDRWQDLESLSGHYSFDQIEDILDAIVNTMKQLGENLNVRVPLMLVREKIWERSYR